MNNQSVEPVEISISLVVPVYAGEAYLPRLVEEIGDVRAAWAREHAPMSIAEVILVDDNAIDGSAAVVDQLARTHDWVVALHLSRNYGQHSATVAGIAHSSGDWIVTLDEDLQHPPARIAELLRHALIHRADIVYARPSVPVHRAFVRDATSRGFKRLMQWLTDNPKLQYVNSFRLIRGEIARGAAAVCMHDTYFDINLTWLTERIEAVPMALTDERYVRTGRSGYQLRTLLAHAWRMLFSSHLKVLQLGTMLGMATVVLTVLCSILLLSVKIAYPDAVTVRGWTSLMLVIAFFGGVSILMIGIALQYLSTLVLRAHGKPSYFTIDRSSDEHLRNSIPGGVSEAAARG